MKMWLLLFWPLTGITSAEIDAVHLGPGGCISTWRSAASSHCMVKTQCSQYATNLASYALRLVCVGHDGGRILHSFQEGGFDAEETFDTNIACQSCESGDGLTMPLTATATHGNGDVHGEAVKPQVVKLVNASEVAGLEEEVKQLKSSMINMAKVVTQLKLQVDAQSARVALRGGETPPTPGGAAIAAVAVAPHNLSHQLQQLPAMNTSLLRATTLQEATVTFNKTQAAPTARPVSAPSVVKGSLSKAAARQPTLPTMPVPRKARGTSFLGMTMNSALTASVDAAGREAEEAAREAEKEAERLAAAVTSDAVDTGASIEHVLDDALAADDHH